MVDRILLGDHPLYGMGGYVSIPGVDVKSANTFQLMWSTLQESMQIVTSGSFAVDGSNTGGTFAPITWPNLGYLPLIMIGCDKYEIVFQYLSLTSGQARNVSYSESLTTLPWIGGATTGYFAVTRTPKFW